MLESLRLCGKFLTLNMQRLSLVYITLAYVFANLIEGLIFHFRFVFFQFSCAAI